MINCIQWLQEFLEDVMLINIHFGEFGGGIKRTISEKKWIVGFVRNDFVDLALHRLFIP